MFYCHHLKFLIFKQEALCCHFAQGPAHHVSGPGCEARTNDAFHSSLRVSDPSGFPRRLDTKRVLINRGEMNMKGEARGYGHCYATAPAGTSATGTPQALTGAAAAPVLGKIISILVGKLNAVGKAPTVWLCQTWDCNLLLLMGSVSLGKSLTLSVLIC